MRFVLGVAISRLALLLSWAALLNIIIRDIPEPSSVAEDLVADLAIGIGVQQDRALEIAEEAVASLDGGTWTALWAPPTTSASGSSASPGSCWR